MTWLRPMKSSWASARIRFLSSDGWKEKSKPASVLTVESFAILSAILTRWFSRNNTEQHSFTVEDERTVPVA